MYSVVLLIGSTKFKDVFLEVEEKLALKGYLVFTPSVYNQSGEVPGCGVETKKILDTAAKMKVCRSDIVIVIDKDGYKIFNPDENLKICFNLMFKKILCG